MAKKTVRVSVPENIQDLTRAATTMLSRNDGPLPVVPNANAFVQDIANRLGVTISISPVTPTTVPPPPPGTNLIPTNLLVPLRTAYPQLARDVANLTVIQDMAEQLSTSVVQRLGIGEGQTNENSNTVRAIFSRVAPVLKGLLAGNENEMQTYGIGVTLGTAAVRAAKPATPAKAKPAT